MIYEIYLDDELLYFPNDENYSVMNAVFETALNECGAFECDVPVSNPRYDDFALRKSMIQITKDGVEVFYGEVREIKQNQNFTKHIYAVGELAFLFDSIQPQARYQTTPLNMLTSILANHNSQVEARKQFTIGNVLVSDPNNYVYHYTNREDTLTAIREKLCDTLDGYLRIRKSGGVRYLDLVPLSSYGKYCTQEIAFGENLLDYSGNYTAEDIATCVIPLGARFDDEHRTSAAIEGLDEYLTIKGTTTDSYHVNKNDDFIYIQSAVNTFGWVRVVKKFDDITVAENLKTAAEDWLTSAQYSKLELELNAIDLSLLDHNIDSFEVGDTIHAWAEPYNMDTTFPVRKKTTYINDLSKNYIVLGNTETSRSYTKQASEAVTKVKEEIPQTFSVMQEAKLKALAMLLDESTGGHVVFEYHIDNDGNPDYIDAISVCNAATIDASTKRWRWSGGAFGFLERQNINVPWDYADVKVALTADGEVDADRIKTGTLDADAVKVHGKIEATSGYIGNEKNGWAIGSNNIYNGVESMADTSHNGTYVGVDGIKFRQSPTDPTPSAETRISRLGIYTDVGVTSKGGFSGGNVSVNSVFSKNYYANDIEGASGTLTWVDRDSRTVYALRAEKGIIVYINSQNY